MDNCHIVVALTKIVTLEFETTPHWGSKMHITDQNVAASLLAMPQSDVTKFVKQSMKERTLCSLVSLLNRDALSKVKPDAEIASKALKKMGFVD